MENYVPMIERVLKPYNYDCADDVFSILFRETDHVTEDGLTEIPAASYQIVVSALELMLWEVKSPESLDTLRSAIRLVEGLRDCQKMREWKRAKEG